MDMAAIVDTLRAVTLVAVEAMAEAVIEAF
jgi:hypothetical protein